MLPTVYQQDLSPLHHQGLIIPDHLIFFFNAVFGCGVDQLLEYVGPSLDTKSYYVRK